MVASLPVVSFNFTLHSFSVLFRLSALSSGHVCDRSLRLVKTVGTTVSTRPGSFLGRLYGGGGNFLRMVGAEAGARVKTTAGGVAPPAQKRLATFSTVILHFKHRIWS